MEQQALDEARGWLRRATTDLRAGAADLRAEPPIVEDALFHAQQAAEKSLKAFLTAHGCTFSRTHDLDVLAVACEEIDESLIDILENVRPLTAFAWAFRYPGDWETPEEDEAEEALKMASLTHGAVAERLGMI